MNKAKAELNNLRIAPRKVRLVASVLRGRSANAALAELQVINARSSGPIAKLLKSAIANAKNKQMDTNKLFIESIMVDQGPMLKRSLPRAMGRATPIHKKFSHVTLILAESDKFKTPRFTIYEKPKKKKDRKGDNAKKPKFKETEPKEKEAGPAKADETKSDFTKRIFKRKTI